MTDKRKFQITRDFIPFEEEKKEMNLSSFSAKKLEDDKRTTFTIIVNNDFKRQVKAWCAHKNIPIKEAFIIALKDFMKNNPY